MGQVRAKYFNKLSLLVISGLLIIFFTFLFVENFPNYHIKDYREALPSYHIHGMWGSRKTSYDRLANKKSLALSEM